MQDPNAVTPSCHGVLEACLYAQDLDAAARFYSEILGLVAFAHDTGRHVFFRTGAASVFLLFNPERTREAAEISGGIPVPPHGATGAGHVAFAVAEDDLDAWRAKLTSAGVAIEAEIAWPRGGRSLYVRDPAGNSVELASPKLWGLQDPGRTRI